MAIVGTFIPINIIKDSNNNITSITGGSPGMSNFYTNLIPYYNKNSITTLKIDINLLEDFIMPNILKLQSMKTDIINIHNNNIQYLKSNISMFSMLSMYGIILVQNNTNNNIIEIIIPNILFTSENITFINYLVNNGQTTIIDMTAYKSLLEKLAKNNSKCTFVNHIGFLVRFLLFGYIIFLSTLLPNPNSNFLFDLITNFIFDIEYNNYVFYDPTKMNFITFSSPMCDTNNNPTDSNNKPTDSNMLLLLTIIISCLIILLIVYFRLKPK